MIFSFIHSTNILATYKLQFLDFLPMWLIKAWVFHALVLRTFAESGCIIHKEDQGYYNITDLGLAAMDNRVEDVDDLLAGGCKLNFNVTSVLIEYSYNYNDYEYGDYEYDHGEYGDANIIVAGMTALHIAATEGSVEMVKKLLTIPDIQVNMQTDHGATPLFDASSSGYVKIMDMLISAGADVNLPDSVGWTPLHQAVAYGYPKAAQLLIEAGTGIDIQGTEGETALMMAATFGYPDCVQLLLDYGADLWIRDIDNYRAVNWAIDGDDFESVKLLRSAMLGNTNYSMINCTIDEEDHGYYNISDLGLAVLDKRVEDIDNLLAGGCDINYNGTSVLLEYSYSFNDDYDYDYYDYDDDIVDDEYDTVIAAGVTALHVASLQGHVEMVEKLLSVPGIELNMATTRGSTPLFNAASGGYTEIIKQLINAGADVNTTNIFGWTPIHEAAAFGEEDAATVLIEAGIDIDIQGIAGDTAIMVAAAYRHPNLVKLLVDLGADIYIKDSKNQTVLDLAMKSEDYEAVKILTSAM